MSFEQRLDAVRAVLAGADVVEVAARVAEFQRRGIIHFHALIRLDGPPTDTEHYPAPAADVDSTRLAGLIS